MDILGQLLVMARIPSSVTLRQWLTLSSRSALEQRPRDRAFRPAVVTCSMWGGKIDIIDMEQLSYIEGI